MEIDQAPGAAEGAGDTGETTETAAELKAKLHSEVLNHIDQNSQNGFSSPSEEPDSQPDAAKEHRDKHRDKDRHSSKHSSSSDKHKHHSSSSDKHKHSSSPEKHKSSSSSDKHRSSSDKHKHDKHHSSSSSKHKDGSSSSSHKHSSSSSHRSSSDKHKDGHSSSSRHKEGSSSSSSKDKHSSSSSSKDKHHSSSSSDKHKHSSSSSKHKESSDKHRDRGSEHKHSKDRHSTSSSSRKDHKSSSHKHGDSKKENLDVVKHEIKAEKETDQHREKLHLNEEAMDIVENGMTVELERLSPEKLQPSPVKTHVKFEPESSDDEDVPLSVRLKQEIDAKPAMGHLEESDDDDDEPLAARKEKVKKVKQEKPSPKPVKRKVEESDSEDERPVPKKQKKKVKPEVKEESVSPKKKGKKGKPEEPTVWKWWEEDKTDDGNKWNFLEHKGPVFAPPYERLPKDVRFYYDGEEMLLSEEAEEVATFYGKMLEHDYTTKDVFNNNFMKCWRKVMTPNEKLKITDLKKCNFREMCEYFKAESEKRKNRSKQEKLNLKEENQRLLDEYGYCTMDGHKEKIGNFRIEPPGLFRGRGEHPKQGMLKTRTVAEDIIINCSKDSEIPEAPKGHKWKRVQHDNKVTWLASWNENIQGSTKYIMLNASSRLKGEKDWQKYETARQLHRTVDKIRANYQQNWRSKEMRIRQRSVALYFIDKLALRAGNEKEEGESADTVGCCSLRVEHITLFPEKDGKQFVVQFDFLGKDSIRYVNTVAVEKQVYKNLQMFMDNKQPGDDLFDRLNTVIMNKHLHELMDGLTAKVFRTYNASRTLQEQLDIMTNEEDPVAAKMLSYNRANRAVAILCNHQRAAPKNFSVQMENIMAKIKDKRGHVKESKKQLKEAKANFKAAKNQKNKMVYDKKKKAVERMEEQLTKLEVQATDKDENKEIALGTSKLNYLDPRISVAWCKKWEVPLEKVYNKTQRDKFRWAIDMAGPEFHF